MWAVEGMKAKLLSDPPTGCKTSIQNVDLFFTFRVSSKGVAWSGGLVLKPLFTIRSAGTISNYLLSGIRPCKRCATDECES